jgi:hypothetical protein
MKSTATLIRNSHAAELRENLVEEARLRGQLAGQLPASAWLRIESRLESREIASLGAQIYDLNFPARRAAYLGHLLRNLANYRDLLATATMFAAWPGSPTTIWDGDGHAEDKPAISADVLAHLARTSGDWHEDRHGTWHKRSGD